MAEFRVIKSYQRIYAAPITGNAGDPVTIIKRDDDEPGWRWCEHRITGLAGWVPEAFLDIDGAEARLTCSYNALELTVAVGEQLIVIKTIAGWSFCQLADHRTGWVPTASLEPVDR